MAAMPSDDRPSFDTLAVHAGAEPDEFSGAVAPPIYQTSTYAQDGVGKPRRGFEYGRSQNPTRDRLERAVAALEGGTHGFAFASGSAVTAAIADFRQRVGEGAGSDGTTQPRFEVESYLEHQSERFSEIFDANCFLTLSQAMDEFDLAEHGGSLEAAFARLRDIRALVIGVETDILFPIHQQREIDAGLRAAGAQVEFQSFPSAAGHDSFLVDLPRFEAAIGGFLGRR